MCKGNFQDHVGEEQLSSEKEITTTHIQTITPAHRLSLHQGGWDTKEDEEGETYKRQRKSA